MASNGNKFYAYFVPRTGKGGVADSWEKCGKLVTGEDGARYKGFRTRDEAKKWLELGANYQIRIVKELESGIYFDAGTGRGQGVEISVTDEKGKNLLHKAIPKEKLNHFGKFLLDSDATNNYGELLAMRHAIEIAAKKKIKKVFGDSKLVTDYWSKGFIKKAKVADETVELAMVVAGLREEFEESGGAISRISGDNNPADLGFHR